MVTPCMALAPDQIQKTVPSLITRIGGPASARSVRASTRPAAQVPPSSTQPSGNFVFLDAELGAHQRRDLIEQRDGERAPFHDQRGIDGIRLHRLGRIAQRDHAEIDEQAAIAVFGKAGQAVHVADFKSRLLQRLDQRIGQPLRQLVERHETVGRVGALDRGMFPGVAQRHAAEHDPSRPDRAEMQKQGAQNIGRGNDLSHCACSRSNKPPGRALSLIAKTSGAALSALPSLASKAARPSRPASGLPSRDLKSGGELRRREARQLVRVGAQRIARIARESARLEHPQACNGKSFGAAAGQIRSRRRDRTSPARRRHRAAPTRWRDRIPRGRAPARLSIASCPRSRATESRPCTVKCRQRACSGTLRSG